MKCLQPYMLMHCMIDKLVNGVTNQRELDCVIRSRIESSMNRVLVFIYRFHSRRGSLRKR